MSNQTLCVGRSGPSNRILREPTETLSVKTTNYLSDKMLKHRPKKTAGGTSDRLLTDGGESLPTVTNPTAKQWRVVAMLDSGKPRQLGNTYRRGKAEKLRDAHRAALNGDETSPVRPPKETDTVRVLTIEEHEAKRLQWRLDRKTDSSAGEDSHE